MKKIVFFLLILLAALLAGCNMRTVEDMYHVPQRSEEYENLQMAIDGVLSGLEYSAPISGVNRQSVQMVDLDGDGSEEYLLFAKGGTEQPMQIFIFTKEGEEYRLLDTIRGNGSAFDQVEYVRMDRRGGYELIVGRQLSDQVSRNLSVYTLVDGNMVELLTTDYAKFVCCDLADNGMMRLLVLRSGESDSGRGVAEVYSLVNNALVRSREADMSQPASNIRRIMVSRLQDGTPAVYVASSVDGSSLLTDIFAFVQEELTNVTFANASGTHVQTLRNYFVYADDIDNDGILELPNLITMKHPELPIPYENQYLIRWYAMTPSGEEVDKRFTYHNYAGGWYLELRGDYASRVAVIQRGNSYEFYIWDELFQTSEKVITIHALTGQKREEQAVVNNRFVLYRTESTVYAAELTVSAGGFGMSKDGLIASFHPIVADWNTGET